MDQFEEMESINRDDTVSVSDSDSMSCDDMSDDEGVMDDSEQENTEGNQILDLIDEY